MLSSMAPCLLRKTFVPLSTKEGPSHVCSCLRPRSLHFCITWDCSSYPNQLLLFLDNSRWIQVLKGSKRMQAGTLFKKNKGIP